VGAGKSSHENSPIGAAEIEGHIELLAAQGAKNLQLLPKRPFVRGHFNCPCTVHTGRKSEDFAANWGCQDVQLGATVISFQFMQCRQQMNGVAKKTEVNDDNFASVACPAVETGEVNGH
jgi:hypothetical protein